MKRVALVNNHTNVVETVIMVGDGYVPPDGLTMFPSDSADIGDVRHGAEILKPDGTRPENLGLRAYATTRHNARVRTGFTVDRSGGRSTPVTLSWDSRIRLVELSLSARDNAGFSASWVDASGWSEELTAQQILSLHNQVLAFLAVAHRNLSQAYDAIAQGTATTREQVDAILNQG